MKPFALLAFTLLSATALRGETPPTAPVGPESAAAPAGPVPGEWISLFNGRDLRGWMHASGADSKWAVANGVMTGERGSGDIWTKARFGNFVLEVEFNTTGNSGVFIRTDSPKNCVQTGIEIQVDNPGGPDTHSVGAIYDLVAPVKNPGKAGEWNKFVITAQGSKITVELNGETVSHMDLDRWTEVGKNPDGSGNKFKRPLKDWKRNGHIGLQDHGAKVFYRNLRIKPLP